MLSSLSKLTEIPYYVYVAIPIMLLKFNDKYFDVKSTNCLKGFLAMGVIMHHISQSGYDGGNFQNFHSVGVYIVGLFFIVSGYGLYYQLKNKHD